MINRATVDERGDTRICWHIFGDVLVGTMKLASQKMSVWTDIQKNISIESM